MPTYLFAWNPKRWTWNELDEQVERVGVLGYADDRWSTGNTKDLPAGSRYFLIRLGSPPKGIIGSGITLTDPRLGPHWDRNRDAEAEALYANLRFDFLSRDIIVTYEELQRPPFASFHWGVQSSGIRIPETLAAALEKIWAIRIGRRGDLPVGANASLLPEGATRHVTVNTWERNPIARAACLAHHGSRCKVCEIELSERFGPIASGFIHVHHIVPLSSIRKIYHVDPVKDVVPVCPTCHAVLHLRVPPLSVSEARALLKAHSQS